MSRKHNYSGDPYRPQFHFLPPHGWIQDPDGIIFHNGSYHSSMPEGLCSMPMGGALAGQLKGS